MRFYRFGFFRLQFVPERLAEGYSLHVWSPLLFDEKDEAPHNHNSRMVSRVLDGSITNRFWGDWEETPEGLWRPVETLCSDTFCQDLPPGNPVNFELLSEGTYSATSPSGDYYEMPHGSVHSTEFVPGTITLIRKTDIDPFEKILNLLPTDQTPRQKPFDITSYPQDKAWAEVDAAVNKLKASIGKELK